MPSPSPYLDNLLKTRLSDIAGVRIESGFMIWFRNDATVRYDEDNDVLTVANWSNGQMWVTEHIYAFDIIGVTLHTPDNEFFPGVPPP